MENEMINRVFLVEYQNAIEARDTLEDQTPYNGNWTQAAEILKQKVRRWLRYLKTINPTAYNTLEPKLEAITGKYEESKQRFIENFEKDDSCPLEMDNYHQNLALKEFKKYNYILEAAEKICMDKNLI